MGQFDVEAALRRHVTIPRLRDRRYEGKLTHYRNLSRHSWAGQEKEIILSLVKNPQSSSKRTRANRRNATKPRAPRDKYWGTVIWQEQSLGQQIESTLRMIVNLKKGEAPHSDPARGASRRQHNRN